MRIITTRFLFIAFHSCISTFTFFHFLELILSIFYAYIYSAYSRTIAIRIILTSAFLHHLTLAFSFLWASVSSACITAIAIRIICTTIWSSSRNRALRPTGVDTERLCFIPFVLDRVPGFFVELTNHLPTVIADDIIPRGLILQVDGTWFFLSKWTLTPMSCILAISSIHISFDT